VRFLELYLGGPNSLRNGRSLGPVLVAAEEVCRVQKMIAEPRFVVTIYTWEEDRVSILKRMAETCHVDVFGMDSKGDTLLTRNRSD
jgi:hypothetical protein